MYFSGRVGDSARPADCPIQVSTARSIKILPKSQASKTQLAAIRRREAYLYRYYSTQFTPLSPAFSILLSDPRLSASR